MRLFTAIIVITLSVITLLAATVVVDARAHEVEPLLYVDQDGEDSGLCNDVARPCRSIDYALQQAGKGTQIRVAGGAYDVTSTEVLFHIVSGVVDIDGGFDRDGGFAKPGAAVTTLTGVPLQYSAMLNARGFHVIVDQKGSQRVSAEKTDKMLAVHRQLKSGAAIEECSGGMAGTLPCERVDLLGHIAFNDLRTRPTVANDIWGFVDLNSGREYVITGFNTGSAVFDIGDPENPREVGFVGGQNSTWRDVKILQRYDTAMARWRAYAYVTTDATSDGLHVIDLSGLPHAIERIAYASDFQSSHNLFLTNTDPTTGLATNEHPQYLVLAGSNRNAGQVRAYSLDNPAAPALVQGDAIPDSFGAGDRSYAHDVASLTISDARVSQCPNATTACELLLDFNEQNIEVWDMSKVTTPQRLNPGRQEYPQRGYVHSGWPSEDGQYMFVQDELDERDFNMNTLLRVFSLADLTNPQLVGSWTGPTRAIDHNGFVRGNRYYMSNYSRGLTVLDISDPEAPVTSGRIDTYPFGDGGGFVGAWGVYPYFPSGVIAVSDIDSGVYLLRDRTRDVEQGSFVFGSESYAAVEGLSASLTVQRSGNSVGSVSVDYEIVSGTADGTDYSTTFETLNWADGDSGERTITLMPTDDGVAEGSELLLVRLVNPAGGASLGEPNIARVHLSDAGDAASLVAFADAIDIDEQGFGRAVVVLQRQGSAAGAASIDYAVSGGDATPDDDYRGPASGTIAWPDGDANPKTVAFDIVDDGVEEAAEFFDLVFSNASGAALSGSDSVRITIAASTAPPPAGGGSNNGGSGGGGAGGWLLLVGGCWLLAAAAIRRGACALSFARDRRRWK
jgi:choice-of-anchor B domain-containing protein